MSDDDKQRRIGALNVHIAVYWRRDIARLHAKLESDSKPDEDEIRFNARLAAMVALFYAPMYRRHNPGHRVNLIPDETILLSLCSTEYAALKALDDYLVETRRDPIDEEVPTGDDDEVIDCAALVVHLELAELADALRSGNNADFNTETVYHILHILSFDEMKGKLTADDTDTLQMLKDFIKITN